MFLIPQLPPPTFKVADKWSPACNAWLARALQKDPSARPDAATLLQDPFMLEAAKLTPDILLDVFSRAKGRVRVPSLCLRSDPNLGYISRQAARNPQKIRLTAHSSASRSCNVGHTSRHRHGHHLSARIALRLTRPWARRASRRRTT
jgi:hypothetical protein